MSMQVLRNREDRLTFGKLKGWKIGEAIKRHPEYVHWLESQNIILVRGDGPPPTLLDDIMDAWYETPGSGLPAHDCVDPDESFNIGEDHGMEDPAWGI